MNQITTDAETAPDGSIRKTIVEYKVNDKGQKIKVGPRLFRWWSSIIDLISNKLSFNSFFCLIDFLSNVDRL